MALDAIVNSLDVLLTMDEAFGGGLGRITDAAVGFSDGRVAYIGSSANAPPATHVFDGSGCLGLPGLIDCHTHSVWAGSRVDEFERRLGGVPYTQILEEGGGILSTVKNTRAASEAALSAIAVKRFAVMRAQGVTTVEVKSGYGLTVADESKMLRAAKAAGIVTNQRIITTFLGGHAIPPEYRGDRDAYVRYVIHEQLPAILGLADGIDVYVDRGAFTLEEGRQILTAGRAAGLAVHVHAEQVAYTGIAELAAGLGALSADHLERIDDAGIAAMAAAGTIAVMLPGAMVYLHDIPPPIAKLRAAGVRFAVATDLNPGTSPIGDLWTAATLACVTMGLTVEESLLGITRNAALALGRPELGRVKVGLPGDFAVMEAPIGEKASAASLIQPLGAKVARFVFRDGVPIVGG